MNGKHAALIFLTALLLAQSAFGTEPTAARLLSGLLAQTLRNGQDATLPPHLSVLLGIRTTEASTPVRQLGFKSAEDIKTINVCASNHDQVVLVSAAASGWFTAYLMSPSGVLRKAIAYRVGGDTRELRHAEAISGFKLERKFWLDKAAIIAAPQITAPP